MVVQGTKSPITQLSQTLQQELKTDISDKEAKLRAQWEKHRSNAAKHLIDDEGNMVRQQIDTWAALDDLGLTPHEFRLLYCIARHEKWGTTQRKKKFLNGCYASAKKLQTITGISRNKIFEALELLCTAKIIEKFRTRGNKGRTGTSLAGWTNEYRILPITDWSTPWEIKEIRKSLKQKRRDKKADAVKAKLSD